jgi:hypothetical protein
MAKLAAAEYSSPGFFALPIGWPNRLKNSKSSICSLPAKDPDSFFLIHKKLQFQPLAKQKSTKWPQNPK